MPNLTSLIAKVQAITQDPGYTSDDITTALNDAMTVVAGGVQRPDSSILTSPLPGLYTINTVTTLTTTYRVALPTNYQRDLLFAVDSSGRELEIFDSFQDYMRTYSALNQSGDVNAIGVKGGYLYYQPIPTAAATLTIHYHRLPTSMTTGTSVPDGLSEQHYDLLVYHAAKERFAIIEDGLEGSMPNYNKWDAKFMQLFMRMEASYPADTGLTYI